MLPSMRHFLRFIDLDDTFDNHGFNKKVSRVDESTWIYANSNIID